MLVKKFDLQPVFIYYEGEDVGEIVARETANLTEALAPIARVLAPVAFSGHLPEDLTGPVFFLYPLRLGCGEALAKLQEKGDVILFAADLPYRALDALEEISDRANVHLVFSYGEAREKALFLGIRDTLRGLHVLALVPDLPFYTALLDRRYDRSALHHRFGVEVDILGKDEFLAWFARADGEEAARAWLARARAADENEVRRTGQLYQALRNFLEDRGYQAVAISCHARKMDPLYVPCLALGRLRDEGIPAACEADLASLTGMILVDLLRNQPAFMGNVVGMDAHTITLSHCAMPLRLMGDEPLPYKLADYHGGRWPGVTAEVEVPVGAPLTVLRVSRGAETMIVTEGRIVARPQDGRACRNTLQVEVPDPALLLRKTSGNHHVLACGHFAGELARLGEFLGMDVTAL